MGNTSPCGTARPSVRYALCRIVVEDSVSLLFSEGHFPTIDCADHTIRACTRRHRQRSSPQPDDDRSGDARRHRLCRHPHARSARSDLLRRPGYDISDTRMGPEEPDTLTRVTERYKVAGNLLALTGYTIADASADYWFTRCWDVDGEIWYEPVPVGSSFDPEIDETRSVQHGLGFVPIVWIRNLPGPSSTGDPPMAPAHSVRLSRHRSRSTISSARQAAA